MVFCFVEEFQSIFERWNDEENGMNQVSFSRVLDQWEDGGQKEADLF